jgi:uncharacterized protein (TIGR03083 family)
MIPTTTIDTLVGCWHSLGELGAGLSEAQWKTATDLPGWTVQDNLSHLIGIERTLQGLPATTHRIAMPAYVRNPIGEMNEHEVDSRRSLSGADVLAEWNDVVALRVDSLRGGDDAYFDVPMMMPTGPGTLGEFLHIRVLDCWLHEQDMRRAAGVPGNLDSAAAAHTIDRLIRTIPIVVGKRAATPDGQAVVIDLHSGVDRHIVCEVREGRAALVDQPTSEPLTSISLSTEAFVVLAAGRRTLDQVTDGVAITGDDAHARLVLTQFNMMI